MTAPKFDSALPDTLQILEQHFGKPLPETTLVRDALGKLVVILPDNAINDSSKWDALADELDGALGPYSPGTKRVLLRHSDVIIPDDIFGSPDRVSITNNPNTWIVDRLQTNQDWLREPLAVQSPLPTAVAFSIKGGVGRTTAFALWAWYMARQGKNIILVDLDLEAPGLAGMLLNEDHVPDFGLVDWLIECLVATPSQSLLTDCLGESTLSADEPGRIRVLPAFGKRTLDYVNKIGRIYMPTLSGSGYKFYGLAERLFSLLDVLSTLPDSPDAVLLDARAGLHDIGSAAVTRLGAKVFLFARDEHQNWQAYRRLFEHLKIARSIKWGMPDPDLRWRLGMVGAQVDTTEAAKLRFIERSYETWLELYDEEDESDNVSAQLFNMEDSGPHQPAFIEFDPRVKSFELSRPEMIPAWETVLSAFGGFFSDATARLFPE